MHPKMAALRVGAAVAAFVSFVGWATAGTYAPLTEPQLKRLFAEAPRPIASGDSNSARDVSPVPATELSPQAAAENQDPPALTSLQPAPGAPSGPDVISDKVGATAGEFRVDESGAATYSIPLYTVPGTAGVAPKLSLNYSSQGGNGPLGKGWSIGGLSAISRCRATREAGDFISDGVPVDGNPAPVNFGSTDKICLDGQRLIKVSDSPACPVVSGMTVAQWRTEIESFQRVCGYTPSGSANGVVFFTVQRRDGSISWYGDRDSNAGANRPDGYIETNAAGHEAKALQWAQTRFQDSAGNYIDFVYWERVVSGVHEGEHLLVEVRWTGKVGIGAASPYAKLNFTYETVPAARGYQSGALLTRSRRLKSITSSVDHDYNGSYVHVRYYVLDYDPSASGSGVDTLISVTECRDNTLAVCLPATVFNWSGAKNEFAVKEYPGNLPLGSIEKFEGFKLGDIDGDGRKDMIWLKDGASGERCTTEYINVAVGEFDGSGRMGFRSVTSTPACTPTELITPVASTTDYRNLGEASWQLFDYNGDGRDDLFVAGGGPNDTWAIHPSTGAQGQVFNFSQNLLAGLSPGIPVDRSTIQRKSHPQLADLNGDGLLDVVYERSGAKYARLMTRGTNSFSWGTERAVIFPAFLTHDPCANPPPDWTECAASTFYELDQNIGAYQLHDFNGDARSDLVVYAVLALSYTVPERCEGELAPGVQAVENAFSCTYNVASGYVGLLTVQSITSSQVTFAAYGAVSASKAASLLFHSMEVNEYFADFNGDGLTDQLQKRLGNTGWELYLNTGTGLSTRIYVTPPPNDSKLQVADANGDGRADLLYPIDLGSSKTYQVRHGLASTTAGFGTQAALPGGQAHLCEGSGCDMNAKVPMFVDFDGDGALDFISLKLSDSNNGDVYGSRAGASSRYKPRDVITSIVNGFGAVTNISYQPLTNNGVYAREHGSRDDLNLGRGSPIQDLLAPIYVVSKVSSSAPIWNNPGRLSTVVYTYAGAKVQAGGRGFLGFRAIGTYDVNAGGGAYVGTLTWYAQDFPFIGMPTITAKWTVPGTYAELPCHAGTITNTCFSAVGQTPPPQPGADRVDDWFSHSGQVWESGWLEGADSGDFDPGVQRPVHVHTAGTTETLRDPVSLVKTSIVETTFVYSSYGDVTATDVVTRKGDGAWLATVSTVNEYADNSGSKWWLGRLTDSTVTHRRPNRDDVVRRTVFDYDTVTGLLKSERIAPGGGWALDLIKHYDLDAYGNRTAVYTCGVRSDLPEERCKDRSQIVFRPGTSSANMPSAWVQRYARTVYDSHGRFPTHTYEPFWDGTSSADDGDNAVEHLTLQVLKRNEFGDVTHARGLNNADTSALFGTLGRPYYSWTETIQGATPGEADKGVETSIGYRWCAPATDGLSCPTGAKFMQIAQAEGSPAKYTYFDVLARPMLTVAGTLNDTLENKRISAVCSFYNASGKPERVSNPFFVGGFYYVPIFAGNECASRLWTTTAYDPIGRPTVVTSPHSEGSTTVSSAYSGLQTTLTDQRGKTKVELRNALGELVGVTDAVGATTGYAYDAAGNLIQALRHADRGNIITAMTYDAYGRKITQTDPDAGARTYSYNPLGELLTETDSLGHRNEIYYDSRGRVWLKRSRFEDGTLESESQFDYDVAANGLGALKGESITYFDTEGEGTGRSYEYDTLGRPVTKYIGIDGIIYGEAILYDALGRPWKTSDGSGRWLKTEYTPWGYPAATCHSSLEDTDPACPNSALTYLRTLETDARGNAIKERRGNSAVMEVLRSYDPYTGRLMSVKDPGSDIIHETYGWDPAGNLIRRNKGGQYEEEFYYDNVNRLTTGRYLYVGSVRYDPGTGPVSHSTRYDRLGNICVNYINGSLKEYTYHARAGCGLDTPYGDVTTNTTASPHQVVAANGYQYYYDHRGNQTFADASGTANDRTIRYSLADQAVEILKGNPDAPSQSTRFWYGPDGARYKREDGSKRTLYLGNVEIITNGGATTTKRYVAGVMVQEIVGGGATNKYLFHDHLGSVARIANASGALAEGMDFAPLGKRRGWRDPRNAPPVPVATTKGFTGHEHVDAFDIIHMNGRIYDPVLGRFLQADPIVQAPGNPQNWNGYSYVFNNPLAFTDPTGMLGKSERQWLGVIVAVAFAVITQQYWAAGKYLAAFGTATSGGFLSGAITSQSLEGGLRGAFSAAVTFGVAYGTTGWDSFGQFTAMSVTGGVMHELQGGKFGHGFAAAGLTTLTMPSISKVNVYGRTVLAALVGGTASRITGGKFASGAISAAMQAALQVGVQQEQGDSLQGSGSGASLSDERIEFLASALKRNFEKAKTIGRQALDGYCQANACEGISSAEFFGTQFEWADELFYPGQNKASSSYIGAYVDRSGSAPVVRLFAGGIVLQNGGPSARMFAGVLVHEYRHVSPVGTLLSAEFSVLTSGLTAQQISLKYPYSVRLHELDTFNFTTEVMKHAPK